MKKDGPFIKKKQPDGSIKKVGVKVIPAEKPQKNMEVPKPKPKKFKIIKLEPVNPPKPKPKKFKIIKLEPKKAPITNYLDMLPISLKDKIDKQVPILKNLDWRRNIHSAYIKDINEEKEALKRPMYGDILEAFNDYYPTHSIHSKTRKDRRNTIKRAMSNDKSTELDMYGETFMRIPDLDGTGRSRWGWNVITDSLGKRSGSDGPGYRDYYTKLIKIDENLEKLKDKNLNIEEVKKIKNENKRLKAANTKWVAKTEIS